MKRGCGICRLINLVLAIGLAGAVYLIVAPGNVEPQEDGRSLVLLAPDERNMVLGEMRGMLEAVQAIVEAASRGDFQTVAETASATGMGAARAESAALIGKLPLEFMSLGMDTHKAFDALAVTAGDTEDPLVVLAELGTIMNNCTGCHAGYRLGVEGVDGEE